MTSRERIAAAMNLGTPDKVPFMCQLSIGHMLMQFGVSPAEFWFDANIFAEGLLKLRALYQFDGILVSLHGHDPDWRERVGTVKSTSDGEEVVWKDGDTTLCLNDDLPRHLPITETEKPLLQDIRTTDLPDTLDYIPVSQGLHFRISAKHRFDVFHLIKKEIGDEFSLHGEVTSPFDYYIDLFGIDNALMGLIEAPEKAALVIGHFTRLVKLLAVAMCAEGVDAIKISSPFAGSNFISPEFYRMFVLPGEREIVSAIRKRNVHAYTHTCGAIGDRLEMMLEAGVSGIECLDPPPLGDVELEDAKIRLRGKCFIKGNVDSVNMLLFGSEDDIVADAKKRLTIGKEGGGYIFSTACSVAPHVARERIWLLKRAVDECGV